MTRDGTISVGINAICLWKPLTGIGQYTLNVARALESDSRFRCDFFYGNGWGAAALAREAPGISLLKRWVKRIVPHPYEISRAIMQKRFNRRASALDVYLEPNFLPFRFEGPTVLTIHDLSYVRFPETHPVERVRIMAKLLPPAVAQATHILTDSEFQRTEILSHFRLDPARVTACPLGVASVFRPRSAEECAAVLAQRKLTYRNYFLAVGTLEPRKNLALVLEAYCRLPQSIQETTPLVVVGMRGWNTESFAPRLRTLVQAGLIRQLGYIPDDELPTVYSGACALLYPSLYEGFGLPVVEAMASGVPVIVSNRASLPEIVDSAGAQVEPDDVDAMCRELERIFSDPAHWQCRSDAGLERAKRFTWQACAETTARTLLNAVGGR